MAKKRKVKTSKLKHPRQPIGYTDDGIIRFKENAIVDFMLDMGTAAKIFDLNTIAAMPFSVEDRVQLAQLIGYSVSGFGELSYIPKKVVAECDEEARKLYE